MTALYNKIDPTACAVLRQLITDGVIAPGNAIVPVLAAEAIGAFLDAEQEMRAAA